MTCTAAWRHANRLQLICMMLDLQHFKEVYVNVIQPDLLHVQMIFVFL